MLRHQQTRKSMIIERQLMILCSQMLGDLIITSNRRISFLNEAQFNLNESELCAQIFRINMIQTTSRLTTSPMKGYLSNIICGWNENEQPQLLQTESKTWKQEMRLWLSFTSFDSQVFVLNIVGVGMIVVKAIKSRSTSLSCNVETLNYGLIMYHIACHSSLLYSSCLDL